MIRYLREHLMLGNWVRTLIYTFNYLRVKQKHRVATLKKKNLHSCSGGNDIQNCNIIQPQFESRKNPTNW